MDKIERKKQDAEHAKNPQPGDYWHEMLCPILVVLKVSDFQVWFCDIRMVDGDNEHSWVWDLSCVKVQTRKTFHNRLQYDTIDGYWCSVVPEHMMGVVNKYSKLNITTPTPPPTTQEYTDAIFKAYPILDLNLNALGLCGEAGEFANKVKKRMYKEVPADGMIEELADVLWHVAQCAKLLDSSLDELMSISMRKTLQRNNK